MSEISTPELVFELKRARGLNLIAELDKLKSEWQSVFSGLSVSVNQFLFPLESHYFSSELEPYAHFPARFEDEFRSNTGKFLFTIGITPTSRDKIVTQTRIKAVINNLRNITNEYEDIILQETINEQSIKGFQDSENFKYSFVIYVK